MNSFIYFGIYFVLCVLQGIEANPVVTDGDSDPLVLSLANKIANDNEKLVQEVHAAENQPMKSIDLSAETEKLKDDEKKMVDGTRIHFEQIEYLSNHTGLYPAAHECHVEGEGKLQKLVDTADVKCAVEVPTSAQEIIAKYIKQAGTKMTDAYKRVPGDCQMSEAAKEASEEAKKDVIHECIVIKITELLGKNLHKKFEHTVEEAHEIKKSLSELAKIQVQFCLDEKAVLFKTALREIKTEFKSCVRGDIPKQTVAGVKSAENNEISNSDSQAEEIKPATEEEKVAQGEEITTPEPLY